MIRGMSRITAVAVLLAALALPATAAPQRDRDCELRASQEQLDESPRAVLYRTRSRALFGCLRNGGRRTQIARRAPAAAFVKLEGRFAAFESLRRYELTVTDLRTGEQGPALPSFQGRRPRRGDAPSIVRLLVGTARRVVWAVVNPRAERNEIYASRGRQTFCLDRGADVDLESLRLKNGGITWFAGDRLRLVRLRTPGLRDVNCSR